MSRYRRYITMSDIPFWNKVSNGYLWFNLSLQDTVVTVPPYPYVLDGSLDVPLDQCWYACPQLLFACLRVPSAAEGRAASEKNQWHVRWGRLPTWTDVLHRIYSTLEPLDLPDSGPIEIHGVPKFYLPSPTPVLYAGPMSNVLRPHVPLIPLFLRGNSTPTIPHKRRHLKGRKFPHCSADASNESSRKGATPTS